MKVRLGAVYLLLWLLAKSAVILSEAKNPGILLVAA